MADSVMEMRTNVCVENSENFASAKKEKPCCRLVKREPKTWEAPGTECWDMIVECGEERCVLEDVARSIAHAERLKELFEREEVYPVQAPFIMEDLLACGEMLE